MSFSATPLAGMAFDAWLAFLAASLVTAFTPGQAIVLAISNALAFGRRRALLGSLGNAAGLLVVAGATLFGLGVALRAWPPLFDAIKLCGAAYLVWLGLQPWLSGAAGKAAAPASGRRLFWQGMGVALTNPKGILFFAALFPQFAPEGPGMGAGLALMTATFLACALLAHGCFIAAAPWTARALAGGRSAMLARRAGGLVFIALGLGMLSLRLPG